MAIKLDPRRSLILVSAIPTSSRGSGPDADIIKASELKSRRKLQETKTLGYPEASAKIATLLAECRDNGWDFEDAAPVTHTVAAYALAFLSALPSGLPAPHVSAEPDGQISFEWFRSPTWTYSVSVSGEGNLHYAGLFNDSREFGSVPFHTDVPAGVIDLIDKVAMP